METENPKQAINSIKYNMATPKINYGYIPSKIEKEHYLLGSGNVPYVIHRKDGNWFSSRPQKELQNTFFETYNCTGFNTLAQIECYMKEVFGLTVNYSDRALGIFAGTKPPGNDPQNICEAIRKYGLVPDDMLPNSSDLQNVNEYYSYKGGDEKAIRAEGQKWLEKWDFLHDWAITPDMNLSAEEKLKRIRMSLLSSPLSISVYAWAQDGRQIYVRFGEDNHWTFQWAQDLFGKVEDSYEPTLKDVDQDIQYCKRIYIRKREVGEVVKKKSFWTLIIEILKSLLRR